MTAAIINEARDPDHYHGNAECNRLRRGRGASIVVTQSSAALQGFSPCPSFSRYGRMTKKCWTHEGYVVPFDLTRIGSSV